MYVINLLEIFAVSMTAAVDALLLRLKITIYRRFNPKKEFRFVLGSVKTWEEGAAF